MAEASWRCITKTLFYQNYPNSQWEKLIKPDTDRTHMNLLRKASQKRMPNNHQLHQLPSTELTTAGNRIHTIDMLRGLVMVIMALDHVRDYFHFDAYLFSPTDPTRTTPLLFATRWITHICAPTFILLAGTSAYLVFVRKGRKETAKFLLTRGAWLVFLQFTVIIFGWTFDIFLHYNGPDIISAIGFSMMVLAGLLYLPRNAILILSLIVIGGHNAFDNISFPDESLADIIWSFFHAPGMAHFGNGYTWETSYPLFPWAAVMALGFYLGDLYTVQPPMKRRRILFQLGVGSLLFFLLLRGLNVYGDPNPWTYQRNNIYTVLSFLNLTKYPPSLLYLCATLGISFLLLGSFETANPDKSKPLIVFGRVPMFYYVVHIYIVHLLAMGAAILTGHSWKSMIFYEWVVDSPVLEGSYGFSLGTVYIIWIIIVAGLYPLCMKFEQFKIENKHRWWVSYV